MRNFPSKWMLDCAIFLVAAAGTHLAQLADRPITGLLIFLVGVILIALNSGLIAALVAAVAASVVYNFFLSEPIFEFGVTTLDEAVPLIAFNLTAFLTGTLVGRLRDTANRAFRAKSETEFLLAISDGLQRAMKLEEVETAVRRRVPSQGVTSVELYIAQGDEFRRPGTGDLVRGFDPVIDGTDEGHSRQFVVLELVGARGVLGFVKFEHPDKLEDRIDGPDLKAVSSLIALAVERCLLLEEVAETRAQAKTEALKDSLLSSVSHDLRTPITVIEAAAGALVSPKIKLPMDQQSVLLKSIIEQCRRLDRYTSELLDVGQIKAGISSRALEVVDLKELASLAIRQFRNLYPAVEIRRDFDRGPVLVNAHPTLIEQAIFNLLDNARKYGGCNECSIGIHAGDAIASLSVEDNGPGIDGSDLDRIFERFFKGGKQQNVEGSGLGLSIAKGFVEASGGNIEAESPVSEGRGTRIWLRFPLIEEQASSDVESVS